MEGQPDTTPLPPVPPGFETDQPPPHLPAAAAAPRADLARPPAAPGRLRAIIAAVLSLVVLALIPGSAAAPADVVGLVLWFVLTARSDLAPPPRR